ncbi:nucleotide sugar dehydrogenase [Methanosphaerula palustris]|uniref:UDP-N-acetyl-D-mannosamine dehydrogenase n=1 Tax=Methanosphaerula palustris (strain ATCC BAA-1556 / DSM 19958 / E1-9c) TaxID=521011 RepID=B8GGM6_METPE|nr:nucleotide sugar dehydrogenase [Methanosphaerula palustris]ACL16281.1 nucleotide sugar dehydrogenase [Methanosphaerula palustris E1-9c]
MVSHTISDKTVCVVGLGYVGLPLAEDFSQHLRTIGFRRDQKKVDELNATEGNRIEATTDPARIREADFVIIAVPTPVNKAKDPDLEPVESSAKTVGKNLKKGAIVVLESTVYPGVTEGIMGPILERESGMVCGKDFAIGYSPERINPGDEEHVLARINKVVSGMDAPTLEALTELYGLVTNVYPAPNIRTAEASKVIENVQRDLNIALMNELSMIFSRLDIDTEEVLKAAGTKWNFHHYRPGMVGGHCIPVDPYYLVKRAKEVGYHAQVILAGRSINDSMPKYVADLAVKGLNKVGKTINGSKVLIMGLTYKEDVADIRESPVENMVHELKEFDVQVYGYDPLLSDTVIEHFGAIPLPNLDQKMDAVIIAVAHQQFRQMPVETIRALMNDHPVLIDVRGMVDQEVCRDQGIYYRKL